MKKGRIAPIETYSYKELCQEADKYKEDDDWIFRGQFCEWNLETYLERAIECSGLKIKCDSNLIESQMIRDFRRYYNGDDKEYVLKDTLYCLSLLQHHGAPTRLHDWTYSKHIAIYNALECAFNNAKKTDTKRNCAVWCLNTKWCDAQARIAIQKQIQEQMKRDGMENNKAKAEAEKKAKAFIDDLGDDEKRIKCPKIFDNLFINHLGSKSSYKFVVTVNPFRLHNRLYIQQAVSLCPGDVTIPFEDNLTALKDYANNVIKITCTMDITDFKKALAELWRMNISRASLYPGFDGFAQSMKYKLSIYEEMYASRREHGQKL
jgi:hypothetical protein